MPKYHWATRDFVFQITFDLLTNALSVVITTIAYELNSLQNNVLFCVAQKEER